MTQQAKSNFRVSFDQAKDRLIPDSLFYEQRRKDGLKDLWYTREELMESCNEAKRIVTLRHNVDGKLEAIDHSQHCVVGLEKYHGKKEREKYRKMLIRSVLIRQEMNRGLGLGTNENGCLSEISQMMSASFKDFALWQAAMHEFHAYGSSTPSKTLIATTNEQKKRTNEDIVVELPLTKKRRQQIISTTDPSVPSLIRTTSSANIVLKPPPVQNQKVLHADMMKVMKGYVERKRLRSEVCTLIHTECMPIISYPQSI